MAANLGFCWHFSPLSFGMKQTCAESVEALVALAMEFAADIAAFGHSAVEAF